jgi:hypothetical protein
MVQKIIPHRADVQLTASLFIEPVYSVLFKL